MLRKAFAELTGPYRRELLAHCYRMLASAQDAEDAVQDTMLSAWQSIGSFEGRASLRTWLYRIATNHCLNALRSASRHPAVIASPLHDPAETPRLSEAAEMLGTTYGAVASVLKHVRATMARHSSAVTQPPPAPHSAAEQELIGTLTGAYTTADLDALIALLADDVRLSMPPHPFEYHGRAVAARGLGQLFTRGNRFRLVETRVNGQPALAVYRKDPHAGILRADGLLVITLAGPRIGALTMFAPAALARFGLPRTLPA